MCENPQQPRSERRQHLQTLVLLGSLIVQHAARSDVHRQFVVFSADSGETQGAAQGAG